MSPTLLALAPELKLNVIEWLPTEDIVRLRRVCKEMKECIETNLTKISTSVCRREAQRLNDFADKYVYYKDNPDFLEKLARWTYIHGLYAHLMNHVEVSMNYFIKHVLRMESRPPIMEICRWRKLACLLRDLSARCNRTSLGGGYFISESEFVEEFSGLSPRMISDDDLARMYRVAKTSPDPRFHEKFSHGLYAEDEGWHSAPHVRCMRRSNLNTLLDHRNKSKFEWRQISDIFGVPDLPGSLVFVYFLRNGYKFHKLLGKDGPMEPIYKASMMEELFIT